jgi:hypothetical protein
MKTTWTTALMMLLLAGCVGVDDLQGKLRSRNSELMYLHGGANTTEKPGGNLNIGSFVVEDVLPSSTTVQEQSSSIFPFLVVNVWNYRYQSNLGYEQIGNDYKTFIRESFIEDLKRSGKFSYVEDNGDMEIDVKIKTIKMAAPVYKNGMFLFLLFAVSYHESVWAGPVDVVLRADAVLKKNGKELFRREFQGMNRTGALNVNKLKLEDYNTVMVEALSLAIKNLNETIVREINSVARPAPTVREPASQPPQGSSSTS